MQTQNQGYLSKLYTFIRERDAKLSELFFALLNIYILALVILPPHVGDDFSIILRVFIQSIVTLLNITALLYATKFLRISSSIANTIIMALVSTALFINNNPHTGTYVLLTILAAFVCWKINIRQ